MKAGQAVLEALRAEGVEYTFGLVGTTTNSIVTEMYGRNDIRFVDTRHEEGAAFMAYGYARASGKPTASRPPDPVPPTSSRASRSLTRGARR
jgi:thiamine pyrophosphate-dependent acetolactate synthase large subunit-like protein